ncbi:MAG: preprotein translocase subunit YajC [Actinobacteria bacterium]|nr:preprotein translocase subunit YajC [Actinomycetota bacterium]
MQQLLTIIYLIIIIGVFYIFIIRPQQRRQKEHNELIAGITIGDRVITAGGIYGLVKNVDGETVMVEVAPEVELKMAKTAIILKEEPKKMGLS